MQLTCFDTAFTSGEKASNIISTSLKYLGSEEKLTLPSNSPYNSIPVLVPNPNLV